MVAHDAADTGTQPMLNRRYFLAGSVAVTGLFAGFPSFAQAAAEGALPPKSPLGVASTGLSMHLRGVEGVAPGLREDPVAYLEYCRSLGAGGVQHAVSKDIPRFRQRLEELGMYYEGQAALPAKLDADMSVFEASVANSAALGATCMRAVSRPPAAGGSGRRYEGFTSFAEFQAWEAEANAIVEKCLPIAEKYKVAIALENHKDRTAENHAALLKRISSEYLGSLIDPGNNMSFMETPEDTIELLGPYVKACSLKDMGVAPYAEGFLLSEVLFGTGMTDQAALFERMRAFNPRMFPTTELITRDPLKVPVMTEGYHRSFNDRKPRVEGWMKMVAARQTPLPITSTLTPAEEYQLEEDNNRKVFAWGLANIKPA
jgi:sugar phosphate isomerase/epimerase